jgi:hypothetical protein
MEKLEIIERINKLNFFVKDSNYNFDSLFNYKVIIDRNIAIISNNSLNWENLILNEVNRLTLFLHFKDKYRDWNATASIYDNAITSHEFLKLDDEKTIFYDNIKWILGMVVMEAHYNKIVKNIPIFFQELQVVLENGFFPCGWQGKITEPADVKERFDFKSGVLLIHPL